MKNKSFKINDLSFDYGDYPHHNTYYNERCVEVPIGKWFIEKCNNTCIEVGAVMPYYGFECPVVIDICDPYPNGLKINALDYDYKDKHVLSISTVEHFKVSEYGNRADNDSVTCVLKILRDSKSFLITWGLGYNLFLDAWLAASNLKYNVLMKIADENWCVAENKQLSYAYDFSQGSANAICLVTNLTELL